MEEEYNPEEETQQGAVEGADTIGIGYSTQHDHFYEEAGINENNLLDVVCLGCGHGMQVDLRTKVVEGKLIPPEDV